MVKTMKKMLMTATVPYMIGQFNIDNIQILKELGYEVHIACNFQDTSIWTVDRTKKFVAELREEGVRYHRINFPRNPTEFKKVLNSCRQLDQLVQKENYDLIHCHTPVAGVVSRIVAHRRNIKVIYTAHGFHFYEGAPLKNWILYYPVEKFISRWTDVLIVINKEDYKRAKSKFFAGRTVYVPGVGVDLKKFGFQKENRVRKELGIPKDAVILLSVGELNKNKNHVSVIRALAKMPDIMNNKIFYLIVGHGEARESYRYLIDELGLSRQVILLGFRKDIARLYDAADIYVLPSVREGLNVSLMEAMASKMPCACGNIRGNVDLIDRNGGELFDPADVEDIRKKLERLLSESKDRLTEMGSYNQRKIASFDMETVRLAMEETYGRLPDRLGGVKEESYAGAEHLIRMQRKKSLRAALKCRSDELMIISVGELSRRKNHQTVIRALAELKADQKFHTPFRYYIIGEGVSKDDLQRLAYELKLQEEIHLSGFRTDVKELLEIADLFVFPSLQEGLPVALLEAVAAGLPVLCSKIRGNVDLIENEKELFDRNDCLELACKLKNMIQGIISSKAEVEQMVLENYEKLNMYSLSNVSEQMRVIYKQQEKYSGKEHIS